MEALIKRVLLRLFPELSGNLHLPMFAKVVGVTEPTQGGEQCQDVRPYYAVDLQVLLENGDDNQRIPVLRDVVVPTFFAGNQRGLFGKPSIGTVVELAFAYGSPNKPFIRTILPHGLTLTELPEGAQRWQQTPDTFMQMDQDQGIETKCKNYKQEVAEVATRMAQLKQRLKVANNGVIWVGNEADNMLQILDDTINLLGAVAATAAVHTHTQGKGNHFGAGGTTSAPNQTGTFSGQKGQADGLSGKLSVMVE